MSHFSCFDQSGEILEKVPRDGSPAVLAAANPSESQLCMQQANLSALLAVLPVACMVEVKMVSQGSAVDTNASHPGVPFLRSLLIGQNS